MKVQVSGKLTDQKIVEVKTVTSDEDANMLFSKGWILLHGGVAHVDAQGFNAKPHFIMAKVEKQGE